MQFDLGQLVGALSRTIDLVGVDEVHHGRRVAYMADLCGRRLGYEGGRLVRLHWAALLHDCGVSSTRVHKKLVDELDWADSDEHCRVGAERLRRFAPLAMLAEAVRYHHKRWELLRQLPLDDCDKADANLIFLTDRVDALQAQKGLVGNLVGKEEIRKTISSFRHSYFAPESVEAFLGVSDSEAFWIAMEPFFIDEQHFHRGFDMEEVAIEEEGLAELANIFAEIVDAKSPYTAEHSRRVAELAAFLGERSGLSPTTCRRLKVAGLLHDLGKLQISDAILESREPLAPGESAAMRHHSYLTYSILRQIEGLEDITRWASEHHERLDGTGYPFRRTSEEICLESRIISVADIYQAMAQKRPYRPSLSPSTILDHLDSERRQGRVDGQLVDLVASELQQCHYLALGSESVE